MGVKPVIFFAWFLFLFFFPVCSNIFGLELGYNKVRYHDRAWQILESSHFQIYYYSPCEDLAKVAVQYAEAAFLPTCQAFDYVPKSKIPLFVYATGLEFQETNITSEILGEGVGGFTEVFKNRIVLPMDGSYHEFEKVLHHELTHAFQYDVIYGEGWRSINLFKAVSVPTWMMEGMAEWNAQHLDAQGEMVLRDAVLNDQVMPLSLLDSFDHFEQVYMAYKESQSILDYISQVYGRDKVPQLFLKMAGNQSMETIAKTQIGITFQELYQHWLFYYKSQAWSRIKGMPEIERYGEKLLDGVSRSFWSPDGSQLACLMGDRLFLLNPDTKKEETILQRHFQTRGRAVSWSPDGKRLIFAAVEEGEYRIYLYDLFSHRLSRLGFNEFPEVNSPVFSPDGKYALFSAFDYRSTDLYRADLLTRKIERLTDDDHTKAWCQYEPNGRFIYFLDEWEGKTSIKRLELDGNGLPTGKSTELDLPAGTVSSFWVNTGSVFFTSNAAKKIFNLFQTDMDGAHCVQLTNSFTDVVDAEPAVDGQRTAAIVYQKGKESLYLLTSNHYESLVPTPSSVIGSNDNQFLSDSFSNADKVIAAKSLAGITPSATPNVDGTQMGKLSQAVSAPSKVDHLEVSDASSLVVLKWTPLDPDTNTVEGYRIYRSASPQSDFAFIGKTEAAKPCQYADFTALRGKTYQYYVTAFNSAGESPRSKTVQANPQLTLTNKDYEFTFTPDIMLFLAGYDSSFGFVGGGLAQMSDYLGDHRLSLMGDTIPSVQTGLEANYEFSHWRTTVDADFYYFQNYFQVYDLQSGNIVDQYRNNENGFDLNFTYPIDFSTRVEYGIGSQRFEGSPLYLQFSEGISNFSLDTNQWDVANFYTLSFVKDERKATHFWASSGYALNFTLLQALPILDANVQFANLLLETQSYADIGFLNHLIWANRLIGMTSQGPNPQTFFIGNDAPFQAYFTTIRGYGGTTFFGNNLALLNSELRYPFATDLNFPLQPLSFLLLKDIELAGFLDAGMTNNNIGDISTTPLLWSLGTGLRFYTSVYQRALIMFRFDVAWRMDGTYPPTFNFNLAPMF